MFENVKRNIARYLIRRSLVKKGYGSARFTEFIKNSKSYVVIFPEDEIYFRSAFLILKEISGRGKTVTIILDELLSELIPGKIEYSVISFGEKDIDSIGRPTDELISRIPVAEVDTILNLNYPITIFYETIFASIKAKYRVGFIDNNADMFFNFQIPYNSDNPEKSFENLLNSLKMF